LLRNPLRSRHHGHLGHGRAGASVFYSAVRGRAVAGAASAASPAPVATALLYALPGVVLAQ